MSSLPNWRELLSFLSYWCQRIVVFSLILAAENFCLLSLLLAPENCCLLSPIGSENSCLFSPIGCSVLCLIQTIILCFSTYDIQNVLEIFVIPTVLCMRGPTVLVCTQCTYATHFNLLRIHSAIYSRK